MNEEESVTVNLGDPYEDNPKTEPGFTTYVNNPVDTNEVGDYTVTYNLIKTNPTFEAKTYFRVVTVEDPKPVITINGSDNVFIAVGTSYIDAGAAADKGTLETIIPSGGIRNDTPGSYCILYIATHKGFLSFASRTVHVVGQSSGVIDQKPVGGLDITEILTKPGIGLDILEIEIPSKPELGLDISSIEELLAKPELGLDILSIEELLAKPELGLDILSIEEVLAKPELGLDILSIEEVLTKPELGLDISSIEEVLAKPELGLDILSIEELLAKPELGLDILSIEEVLPEDGPISLSGEVIYPEIAEGFKLTEISTWELGTPEKGYGIQSIEAYELGVSEKGYSIESIQHDEFGRPEEGYTFINIESSELGLPEEGYGMLSLYRYKVAVAPPTEGLDIASIDTLPSAGLDITDIETEPAVGLNITGIGVLPNAGLNITSIETEPAVGLNITGIGVLPNAGLDINSIQPTEYSVDIAENVSLEMNWVEPGTFTMGSPTTEEGRDNDETQHEVTLSNGFYLGKYEVTQAQWEQVMENNEEGIDVYPSAYDFAANTENFPVERVSWNDVQVFLRRLNEQQAGNIQEGWEFTLPTEAQWEYACRAGTTTPYSWGDTITGDDANWNSDVDYNYNFTQEVGQYDSNPWGFFDMHGNVLEWTSDWYAAYGSDAVTDPKGPATGSYRARRGGSWYSSDGRWLRSANRGTSTPDTRGDALGFRVVYAQKTVPAFGLDIADIQKSPANGLDITGIETRPFAGVDITGIGEILTLGSDYDTELSSTINLDMIWVEPGTFTMGSPETEEGRVYYQEHQHEVTLTTGFYLGKYEVTQAQYEAVMTGNEEGLDPAPSSHADSGPNAVFGPGPNRPVEMVSFNDIQVFLARLNEQQAAYLPDGWEYALPTEAEWEYTCRAGTTTAYSFGDTITPDDANYKSGEIISAVDVGQYAPNPWGFYDMHGNVWEWTADAYFSSLSEDATDPYYPGAAGSYRVLRGGSMLNPDPLRLRSARRSYNEPNDKFYHIGFRVALRKKPSTSPPSAGLDIISIEPATHTTDLDPNVSMEMIWVEPGTFTMGSPETETDRDVDETQHEVTLTKGFYLGKYEVTQAQYEAVMTGNTNNLSPTPSNWPNNPNRPVESVSWDDVQVFLARLNEQQAENLPSGWAYVLPTEAQWEYAARAGTTTTYSWGDSITTDNANYNWDGGANDGSDFKQTRDVGLYASNPWGFFDMHGNVLEWTADWLADFSSDAQTDPEGPATGLYRVMRGGSWGDESAILRSANRSSWDPSDHPEYISSRMGFRVVLKELSA